MRGDQPVDVLHAQLGHPATPSARAVPKPPASSRRRVVHGGRPQGGSGQAGRPTSLGPARAARTLAGPRAAGGDARPLRRRAACGQRAPRCAGSPPSASPCAWASRCAPSPAPSPGCPRRAPRRGPTGLDCRRSGARPRRLHRPAPAAARRPRRLHRLRLPVPRPLRPVQPRRSARPARSWRPNPGHHRQRLPSGIPAVRDARGLVGPPEMGLRACPTSPYESMVKV